MMDGRRISQRAITYADWSEIVNKIEEIVAKQGEYFVQGEVIKRDETNKLVWLREFGDTPIPLFSFDYTVDVYDETPNGTIVPFWGTPSPFRTKKKIYKVKVTVPAIGETVLVAKHLGADHLPKCVGVLQSTNFIGPAEEL
jgi:hypothetical protein